MSFISNSVGDFVIGAPRVESAQAATPSGGIDTPSVEGDEFHAMVESPSESGESGLGIFKNLGNAQMRAEGALLDVVKTGNPMRMYDATAAMAKFNTQTLVFTKLAAKASQAVDRLTNLQ
jgi:hypothetical protein